MTFVFIVMECKLLKEIISHQICFDFLTLSETFVHPAMHFLHLISSSEAWATWKHNIPWAGSPGNGTISILLAN